MISYDDVLNMNYYKKTSYTGWTEGMRFLIRKEENDGSPLFHVYAWPGPYTFEKTPDDKKIDSTFDFDEDGRKAAVDWLNLQLTENAERWPDQKTAGVW